MKTTKVLTLILAVYFFLGALCPLSGQSRNDSAVTVVVEAQRLALMPLDQIPRHGTFWVVMNEGPFLLPMPFPPYDPTTTPVFSLGAAGQFLVDATGGALPQPTKYQAMRGITSATLLKSQVNALMDLIAQVQTVPEAETDETMTVDRFSMMDLNSFGGNQMLLSGYGPNDLWLEIIEVDFTNQIASLLLHGTVETNQYQLLYTNNLVVPGTEWTLGEYKFGDSATNQTVFLNVSISTNSQMFFRAHQANPLMWITSSGQDAVEPNVGIGDPGQLGIFYVQAAYATNDLVVYYRVSGIASNGVDYTNLLGTATVSLSTGYGEIDVAPIQDNLVEGAENVKLTLIQNNSYLIDPGANSATVQIRDSSTIVSIGTAPPGLAFEPDGPPGTPAQAASFLVYRSDPRTMDTNNLTVFYQISGTTSNGVDYSLFTGSLTFLAGITDTNLDVNPLADNRVELPETVTVTLIPTNSYQVNTSFAESTATILDSSTIVRVYPGLNAIEPGATNDPGEIGNFQITRNDDRNVYPSLVIHYQVSGVASNGLDYLSLGGVVSFASGALSTNINVQPLLDNFIEDESDEMVTLTLTQTNGYYLDTTNLSATILIVNRISTNIFLPVVTGLAGPVGIGYHSPSNSLIVSCNAGFNFVRIFANPATNNAVIVTNWSRVQGLGDEVKLVTIQTNTGGFTNGDTFFSSGSAVGWLSSDGTRSNFNWCVLTNSTGTSTLPLRGSLCADQTGVFSNNLIVVTSDSSASSSEKGVWRVDAQAHPTLLTNIDTLHLEGVITLPNNPTDWGPWAGKIITGDEDANPNPVIYTIATNGATTVTDTTTLVPGGIHPEDFEIIPPNQSLYACDHARSMIVKLSADYLTNYVGDLLITDAGEVNPPAKLFIVHWDAATTNFITHQITYMRPDGSNGGFEHVTFAPIELPTR